MSERDTWIGVAALRAWAQTLKPAAAVLDLGCADGVPVSQTLIEEGLRVYGVDASRTLVAAFRERFPAAPVECCAVEDSEFFQRTFFQRTFDGVVAWGLLFLLPPDAQAVVIHKVAKALRPGGKFLFTSPEQPVIWRDILTGRESISLGREQYANMLRAAGLILVGEGADEGGNHYYLSER